MIALLIALVFIFLGFAICVSIVCAVGALIDEIWELLVLLFRRVFQ